jgi:hypothetical protein
VDEALVEAELWEMTETHGLRLGYEQRSGMSGQEAVLITEREGRNRMRNRGVWERWRVGNEDEALVEAELWEMAETHGLGVGAQRSI